MLLHSVLLVTTALARAIAVSMRFFLAGDRSAFTSVSLSLVTVAGCYNYVCVIEYQFFSSGCCIFKSHLLTSSCLRLNCI